MNKFTYTTQKQVRAAFWAMVDELKPENVSREKITDYSGYGEMYKTDTRVAFVNFVDSLARDGMISNRLAQRVTL